MKLRFLDCTLALALALAPTNQLFGADDKLFLTDNFDHTISRLLLSIGTQFSDKTQLSSDTLQLKLKSTNESPPIFADLQGCSIGGHDLPESASEILLNDKKEISAYEARQGFRIYLRLNNRQHWVGALECRIGGIYSVGRKDKLAELSANGALLVGPDWQDGAGGSITALTFTFAGLFAGSVSSSNVDSIVNTAKLVSAVSYPATVVLARPTACNIGGFAINNANVHFLNNAVPITTDTSFSIANNMNQNFGLRFSSNANAGDKSGLVTCGTTGSLTYTY